jgi:hypothetical protein
MEIVHAAVGNPETMKMREAPWSAVRRGGTPPYSRQFHTDQQAKQGCSAVHESSIARKETAASSRRTPRCLRHKDLRSKQRKMPVWPLLFTLYTLTF